MKSLYACTNTLVHTMKCYLVKKDGRKNKISPWSWILIIETIDFLMKNLMLKGKKITLLKQELCRAWISVHMVQWLHQTQFAWLYHLSLLVKVDLVLLLHHSLYLFDQVYQCQDSSRPISVRKLNYDYWLVNLYIPGNKSTQLSINPKLFGSARWILFLHSDLSIAIILHFFILLIST